MTRTIECLEDEPTMKRTRHDLQRYIDEHGMARAGAAKALRQVRDQIARDGEDAALRTFEKELIKEMDDHQRKMEELFKEMLQADNGAEEV